MPTLLKRKQKVNDSRVPRTTKLSETKRRITEISLDTETTGPDFKHGCRPFFVSVHDNLDNLSSWEWKVDPYDRSVKPNQDDLHEIQAMLDDPNVSFIFHNAKFDLKALESLNLVVPLVDQIEDTMVASHCINSIQSHALKDSALKYLGITDDDERELEEVVAQCRDIASSLEWDIAKKRHRCFPSVGQAPWWKLDMWLPQAVADHRGYPEDHQYRTVCAKYGRLDVIRTLHLWNLYKEILKEEGLWKLYRTRVELTMVTMDMERWGITGFPNEMRKLQRDFSAIRDKSLKQIETLSNGIVKNPRSPKQVQKCLYDHFKFPVIKSGKKGPSTKREVLEKLELLPKHKVKQNGLDFIKVLFAYRKSNKSVEYLEGYQRAGFMEGPKHCRLFPNFNVCGTRTTRFSSTNPNAQNISKQKEYNLRRCFGPAPGRVWFAPDYSNIELRIFAFASGDANLIEAFISGKSVHLIFANLLFHDQFAQCVAEGVSFSDRYKSTLYQNTKNGNFSVIYGASEDKADATYKRPGAYRLIREKMPYVDRFLMDKYEEGKRLGYITTLGGYRLRVPKKDPHKACNYFVQGSAGIAISLALIRIQNYLRKFPDYRYIMQVHDELIFDFPQHPRNMEVMFNVVKIMEKSGDDIGVPLTVETDIIQSNWAEGTDITKLLAA